MTVCLLRPLLSTLILMCSSSHPLHHLFPKSPLIGGGDVEKTQNKLCPPFPESSESFLQERVSASQAQLLCIRPSSGMAMKQASIGIPCLLSWKGLAVEKEVQYAMQDQASQGWILHSPTKFQWFLDQNVKQHCEILQDQSPESFTWYQPPRKEGISKYHLIASPEGMYPNHFNRFLSNLFSKLLSCRFSQQPFCHFAISLKVQTFTLPPRLNPCLMSSCISQWSRRKTHYHAF